MGAGLTTALVGLHAALTPAPSAGSRPAWRWACACASDASDTSDDVHATSATDIRHIACAVPHGRAIRQPGKSPSA